ncbi:MAG: C10 family peptidase [Synergistaceae bacterium]|jgi:hypothetical protein|nr:C10 family peptidase [Synergistaceae bacterium]
MSGYRVLTRRISVLAVVILLLIQASESRGFFPDTDAAGGDFVPDGVAAVAKPLVRARWNFNGLVLSSPDADGLGGVSCYSRYLPFISTRLIEVPGGIHVQRTARRAAVGCANLAMGAVMYTHRFPSAARLPGKSMDRRTPFMAIVEKDSVASPDIAPLMGGSGERGFYEWDKMRDEIFFADLLTSQGTLPLNASFDLDPSPSADGAAQSEMAAFLRDVGYATRSRYVLTDDAGTTLTSTQPEVEPGVFRDVFFYKSAVYMGESPLHRLMGAKITAENFDRHVKPNLKMNLPVLVDIMPPGGGTVSHTVVVDGYGHDVEGAKPLYHILVGHGLYDDGWYELSRENIEGYADVGGVTYNISPDGVGSLVGGRFFDDFAPVGRDEKVEIRIFPVSPQENALASSDALPVVSLDSVGEFVLDAGANTGAMALTVLRPGFRYRAFPLTVRAAGDPSGCNEWAELLSATRIVYIGEADTELLKILSFPGGDRFGPRGDSIFPDLDPSLHLNQSLYMARLSDRPETWRCANADVLLIDEPDSRGSDSWPVALLDGAEELARRGGVVCVAGNSQSFARALADRAGTPAISFDTGAVEFGLGQGKVVCAPFIADPGIAASQESGRIARELVAGLLRYAQERREIRRLSEEPDAWDRRSIDLTFISDFDCDSLELGAALSRDFEVSRASGDVTFALQATGLTLGLDGLPAEAFRILDVSLFAPDGELFGRRRVRGTRVSFPVSADSVTQRGHAGVWKMRINEARGFTLRQVLVALRVTGLRRLDDGDPGYDPDAWRAAYNLISGDAGAEVLVGASNPASADVFLGGGGDDMYLGGTGDNIYTWEPRGGYDTIVNNATKTAPSGLLWIGREPESRMNLERAGDDLVVTLRDGSANARILGSVTVRGWFTAPGMKLATISAMDFEMSAEEIEERM